MSPEELEKARARSMTPSEAAALKIAHATTETLRSERDRLFNTVEQQAAEIGRLQEANTNFACQASDQAQEIERLRLAYATLRTSFLELNVLSGKKNIRIREQAARIQELEASLAEAERLIRKNADMINGYLARIAKLEAQVTALREIAVEDRAEQIYPYTWPLWENLPEDEFERTILGSEKKTVMRGKNGYRQMAREQLQAEHPDAFGTEKQP